MMRGLFAIFNRVDETSRTFLYLPLQATKGIGIVLMLGLPVTLVGAALLIAQAIARWMTYVVYRNSAAWPLMPDRLHRLMLLTIAFLAMLPTVEVTTQSPWPVALVFGWCLLQARHEVVGAWRLAYWLGNQAPLRHRRRALDDPQRGRNPSGRRLVAAVPHGHWHSTIFVARLRQSGVVASLVLEGP
jgi:hypothetical protein